MRRTLAYVIGMPVLAFILYCVLLSNGLDPLHQCDRGQCEPEAR